MYLVINEEPKTIIMFDGKDAESVGDIPERATVLYFSGDTSCTRNIYKDISIEIGDLVYSEKSSEMFEGIRQKECFITNPLIFFKREPSTLTGVWFKDIEILLISYVNSEGAIDITRYMVNVGDSIEGEIENTVSYLRLGKIPETHIYGYNIPFEQFSDSIKRAGKEYFYRNPYIEKKRRIKRIISAGIAGNAISFLVLLSLLISISNLRSAELNLHSDIYSEENKLERLIAERGGYIIKKQGVSFKDVLKTIEFLKTCKYDSIEVVGKRNNLEVIMRFKDSADFIGAFKVVKREVKNANAFWEGTSNSLKIKFSTKTHRMDDAIYSIADRSIAGYK